MSAATFYSNEARFAGFRLAITFDPVFIAAFAIAGFVASRFRKSELLPAVDGISHAMAGGVSRCKYRPARIGDCGFLTNSYAAEQNSDILLDEYLCFNRA